VLSVWGCASIIGLETATTIPEDASLAESGDRPDAADGAIGDTADASGGDPADGDVLEASAEACAPATRVAPTRRDLVGPQAAACGQADGVLTADDGIIASLDIDLANISTWGGKQVGGCVGVGFTGGPYRAVVVHARSVRKACGTDCTGTDCGTGRWFGLFLKKAGSLPTWITTTPITPVFGEYTLNIPPSAGVNPYLYVCRSSSAYTREDIQVDYVAACP
jgi:hypothetical protein